VRRAVRWGSRCKENGGSWKYLTKAGTQDQYRGKRESKSIRASHIVGGSHGLRPRSGGAG